MKSTHRPSYYAMIYAHVKQAGIDSGWAVSIHGSLASDLDLVAIAWTDDALDTVEFLKAIEDHLSGTIWTYKWNGPHPNKAGRITWTMPLETDHYIDMTVIDNRIAAAQPAEKAGSDE